MSDTELLVTGVIAFGVLLVGWLNVRAAIKSEDPDDSGRARGLLLLMGGVVGVVGVIVTALAR